MMGKTIAPDGYIREEAVSMIASDVNKTGPVDPRNQNSVTKSTKAHNETLPDLRELLDKAGGCGVSPIMCC